MKKNEMNKYIKCGKCGKLELTNDCYITFNELYCEECVKGIKMKCSICEKEKFCKEVCYKTYCCKDCAETNLGSCSECKKRVVKIKDFDNFGSYKEFLKKKKCQNCQNKKNFIF